MKKSNQNLSTIGKSRRKGLKKIAITTAYAAPIITTFNVTDMITNDANAYLVSSGSTGSSGGEDRLNEID